MNFKIQNFLVFPDDSLKKVIAKIELNNNRIVFCVDAKYRLLGSISDGDIRRKILEVESIKNLAARDVFNQNCRYSYDYKISSKGEIAIPVFDSDLKIIDIIFPNTSLKIKALIGDGVYVIAEIGNNHQGDVVLGKKLIDLVSNSGANAIKFQHRYLTQLYSTDSIDSLDLSTQYTIDLLKKYNMPFSDLKILFDYTKEKGLDLICTPFDSMSLKDLIEYKNIDALKVASADCTNIPFLREILNTGIPTIISTGMTTHEEIKKVKITLDEYHHDIALLHCNSTYPAPFHDLNLPYIKDLIKLSPSKIVGWSGHERGWHIVHTAIGIGAKIVEKHFTIDKKLEGNDHQVSLIPSEFKVMVNEIREIEKAMFYRGNRELSQGEMMNKENLSKSLASKYSLKKGHIIKDSDLIIKSPGTGLSPLKINSILGSPLIKNLEKGQIIQSNHLFKTLEPLQIDNLSIFKMGIPIRFHDINLINDFKFNFAEFHLSYTDLDFDLNKLPNIQLDFVVHAPELFENDHILDLVSDSEDYRRLSITHLNRVINLTEKLVDKFKPTNKVGIITNIGGFSIHNFRPKNQIKDLYILANKSLNELTNPNRYMIWPQTMPPYPWHFGGQRFHNLFTDPDDIIKWCKTFNQEICLDVSHTGLYLLVEEKNLNDNFKKLIPFTAHFHIADAKKPDGEGLQIGSGVIDFKTLFDNYQEIKPNASFIPEIWQGHKNNGEQFRKAFNNLNILLKK